MGAREDILGRIRRGLGRGPLDTAQSSALQERLAKHARHLIPARAASLDDAGKRDLFVTLAREADATVARVASDDDVPAEVARYLAERNLPARAVLTEDASLASLPWDRTALALRAGLVEEDDAVGVAPAIAAIAETGTLMLISGPTRGTRNNFLPDTQIVVLRGGDVVGIYEEAWDRVRAHGDMPRTVNFVTGPSRTGDIAQKLELGAHGPRRLHIVLVEDGAADRA